MFYELDKALFSLYHRLWKHIPLSSPSTLVAAQAERPLRFLFS